MFTPWGTVLDKSVRGASLCSSVQHILGLADVDSGWVGLMAEEFRCLLKSLIVAQLSRFVRAMPSIILGARGPRVTYGSSGYRSGYR